MAQHDAQRELVHLLERRVFEPVLHARPDRYPESRHAKLKDVQDSTRSEVERFRNYESASKVVQMFHDDLSSAPAQKIHRESRELGLPTLNDYKDEFDRLAADLGVGRS